MYTPEDRQKYIGRARTTLYQRQIHFALYHMAARRGRRAVTGNAPALAEWALEANVGHTLVLRPALEQKAVTMLFQQINPWSSEKRRFNSNHLRWCFTRYTVSSAEFVITSKHIMLS